MAMSMDRISEKYDVAIVLNGYYDYNGRYIKLYDIYTADGCRWDAGLRTLKAVADECKRWEKEILNISKRTKEINSKNEEVIK